MHAAQKCTGHNIRLPTAAPAAFCAAPPNVLFHNQLTQLQMLWVKIAGFLGLLMRCKYGALAAGTRGPMDLMEVPSHVTEHFARSKASVRGFMRHHISGRPMAAPLLQQLRASQRLFEATNLQQQACASPSFFFPRLLSCRSTTTITCSKEEEVS